MNYKQNFEDKFNWYYRNRKKYSFDACVWRIADNNPASIEKVSQMGSYVVFDRNGVDAKEAFYMMETFGKIVPTRAPKLLIELLKCKGGVNFQIKQWAEGRADGTLPLIEFSSERAGVKSGEKALLWWTKTGKARYALDIATKERLPEWVINAVENSKRHYYK